LHDESSRRLIIICMALAILLAGIKIFYGIFLLAVVWLMLPVIRVTRSDPHSPARGEREQAAGVRFNRRELHYFMKWMAVFAIAFLLFMLSLRSVGDWSDMLEYGFNFYAADRNTASLLYSIPREGLYAVHVLVILALFGLVHVVRVPLPVRVFLTIALVLLAFFLSQRWQVDRNVFVVPALLIWASCRLLAELEGRIPQWSRWLGVALSVVAAGYSVYSDALRFMPAPDFRVAFTEAHDLDAQCKGPVIIDRNLQIHRRTLEPLEVMYVQDASELRAALEKAPQESCVLLSERLTAAAGEQGSLSLIARSNGTPPPVDYVPQSHYIWKKMAIFWFQKTS
jgi:hypothetical protein